MQGKIWSDSHSIIKCWPSRTSNLNRHQHFTLNMSYLLQTPMTQTPTTFSAREALTQLRAAPTLSQASTPQGCPLQGLATQALGPQALKTLAFAPQALLTWALTPQGEMDLELGHQAHQDQLGLTATSVSALSTLLQSIVHYTVFLSLCKKCSLLTTTQVPC